MIQPTIHTFYTTQFAGDMHAQFGDIKLTLLQTWSEDDFRRVQENLIGHLVTQKKAKTAAHAIYRDAGRRVRGHLGV